MADKNDPGDSLVRKLEGVLLENVKATTNLTEAVATVSKLEGVLLDSVKATTSLTAALVAMAKPPTQVTPTPVVPTNQPMLPGFEEVGKKEEKEEDSDEATEENTGMLGKFMTGMKQNVMATVNLTTIIVTAFKAQKEIAQTFISAGHKNLIAHGNIANTFSEGGISLSESIKNFSTMQEFGLDMTSKSNKAIFTKFTILGKDTKALGQFLSFNTQTLGISADRSIDLAESLVETAAAYHINSDSLLTAMNSLSKTFLQVAATYGSGTSEAVIQASTKLVAKYGIANKGLVEEMTSALFAGNAKSTKMAAMLGLDISKLATKNAGEAESLIEQAITAIGQRVGGAAGEGSSGFTVEALLSAFGATPGMLALANLGPMTEQQIEESAKSLAEQAKANALATTIETLIKDLTILIMPVLNIVAWLAKFLSQAFTVMNGFFGKFLTIIAASFAFMKIKWAFQKANVIAQLVMNTITATTSGFGVGAAMVATAAIAGAAGLAIMSSEEGSKEDTSKDILSEQEKQTAALYDNQQSKILGQISSRMLQANMYNQQLVLNAEEQLEVAVEAKEAKVALSIDAGSTFEIE